MSFDIEVMPESRRESPFSHEGCTELELNFLSNIAYRTYHKAPLKVFNAKFQHRGRLHAIQAIQKNYGPSNYLITSSEDIGLEGLVVRNLGGYGKETIIRYLSSHAYYDSYKRLELTLLLLPLSLAYPSQPFMAISHIISILENRGVEVGAGFKSNCDKFGEWIDQNHPDYAGTPWP